MIRLRNRLTVTILLLLNFQSHDTYAVSLGRALSYPPANAISQISTLVSAPVQYFLSPDDDDGEDDELKLENEEQTPILTIETARGKTAPRNEKSIESAIETLERDVQLLDLVADDQRNQLSPWEISLLGLSVVAAALSPILFPDTPRLVEVMAPATAAFSASIGIGAEYTGKVAVANGKEVAAAAIICAAESESWLARAERVKAITPLCVGIGATSAAFAIVFPQLAVLPMELYLLSPLVAVLSAAVASLATAESASLASTAISVGNRRFARSGQVGRTWLSVSEQIEKTSYSVVNRWKFFVYACIPAPLIGSIIPHVDLASKAIIIASIAAAQSAYFLAKAEYIIAKATEAVSLKAKSAAISDTYANLSAKSASILPFTSALSSASAAGAAAFVELIPFHSFPLFWECAIASAFPLISSVFATAASVSKERSVVDTEAAMQAASTLALDYSEKTTLGKNTNNPIQLVLGLIKTSWRTFIRKTKRKLSILQAEKRKGGKRLVLYTLLNRRKEKGKDDDIITKTEERNLLRSKNMTAAVSY